MTNNEKLDLILLKLEKLDTMERKMDTMEGKIDTMEGKIDIMEGKIDTMEGKIDTMEGKMDTMEADMQELKQKVTEIDLIIENEIRVNIQRVAEGHLDLSRNLHEAMKPNNEIEMLAIRVRMLETNMKEVQAKVGL